MSLVYLFVIVTTSLGRTSPARPSTLLTHDSSRLVLMVRYLVPIHDITLINCSSGPHTSVCIENHSPLSSHAALSATIPAAKFLSIVRVLQTSLSHSTQTLISIISAQSRHPSLSSIVYNPSIKTMRCRGKIGCGESEGSLRAWSKVGNGIPVGGFGSSGKRKDWRKAR